MYGFLILLPLTLISIVIGWFIGSSLQIADYVEYLTSNISAQSIRIEDIWASKAMLALVASHVLAYFILCFVTVATVRTISAPLPADRPPLLRYFQLFLEVVFVCLPTLVLLWISGKTLLSDWSNNVHWVAVGVLAVGLLFSVLFTVRRTPLELFATFAEPFRLTKTDAAALFCIIVIGAMIAAFALYPRESARMIGMFPVLMLATATVLLLVAAIFSRQSSPVAVISSMITVVLLLHVIDQAVLPIREFRYRTVDVPGSTTAPVPVETVKTQRGIPDVVTAFQQWLEHRRPAIEEYVKKGRTYPVFLVSAQGGGMYAAYHPALSLARLTDYCPEFSNHLFGISSVSGGSLGAAVYSELVRQVPESERGKPAASAAGCSRTTDPMSFNFLQKNVQTFFETDFLSPVIASAILFDVPAFVVPQLRFGSDRAKALEAGFESAWQQLGLADANSGLSADFLGRWKPEGNSPALFMSTTGVSFGIPVLVSQLDWSFNPTRKLVPRSLSKTTTTTEVAPDPGTGIVQTVLDRLRQPADQLQVGISNLLDFRPDVQMNVSTAVGLSARFPFVTPPASIKRNDKISIPKGTIFQRTNTLEMTDGGFYDNSGSTVASTLITNLKRALERDERLKPFKDLIRFHLIRFVDTPARRQAIAGDGPNFELLVPLVAYNSVRLSRGVYLSSPPRDTATTSEVYLLDEWYEGSLNWLLSKNTRINIEKRASWIAYGNEVCCEVRHPSVPGVGKRMPLSDEQVAEIEKSSSEFALSRFIPNADDFLLIMRLLNDGAPPP